MQVPVSSEEIRATMLGGQTRDPAIALPGMLSRKVCLCQNGAHLVTESLFMVTTRGKTGHQLLSRSQNLLDPYSTKARNTDALHNRNEAETWSGWKNLSQNSHRHAAWLHSRKDPREAHLWMWTACSPPPGEAARRQALTSIWGNENVLKLCQGHTTLWLYWEMCHYTLGVSGPFGVWLTSQSHCHKTNYVTHHVNRMKENTGSPQTQKSHLAKTQHLCFVETR
jgi:hypothetical protein